MATVLRGECARDRFTYRVVLATKARATTTHPLVRLLQLDPASRSRRCRTPNAHVWSL